MSVCDTSYTFKRCSYLISIFSKYLAMLHSSHMWNIMNSWSSELLNIFIDLFVNEFVNQLLCAVCWEYPVLYTLYTTVPMTCDLWPVTVAAMCWRDQIVDKRDNTNPRNIIWVILRTICKTKNEKQTSLKTQHPWNRVKFEMINDASLPSNIDTFEEKVEKSTSFHDIFELYL